MKMQIKSVVWLKEKVESNQKMSLPVEAYYKLPLALWLGNEKELASKVFNTLLDTKNLYSFEDEFTLNRHCDNYYNYWLFLYTHFSENVESEKIYREIKNTYDDAIGGFSSKKGEDIFELRSTAFSGVCSYLNNDQETGINSSEFIIELYDQNKISSNHFYLSKNIDGKINYTYEKSKERFYDYTAQGEKPLYYSISLTVINLAIGYLKTKNAKYLSYARKYYDILIDSGDAAILNNYIGKFGIASALMYNITKEDSYANYVSLSLNYFTDNQSLDGSWEGNTDNIVLSHDRTSEFTASLFLMDKILENTEIEVYA